MYVCLPICLFWVEIGNLAFCWTGKTSAFLASPRGIYIEQTNLSVKSSQPNQTKSKGKIYWENKPLLVIFFFLCAPFLYLCQIVAILVLILVLAWYSLASLGCYSWVLVWYRNVMTLMSNCQSIVIKLMNFPTLLITTQNSNSLNQMSSYWCKKVKSCNNKN